MQTLCLSDSGQDDRICTFCLTFPIESCGEGFVKRMKSFRLSRVGSAASSPLKAALVEAPRRRRRRIQSYFYGRSELSLSLCRCDALRWFIRCMTKALPSLQATVQTQCTAETATEGPRPHHDAVHRRRRHVESPHSNTMVEKSHITLHLC